MAGGSSTTADNPVSQVGPQQPSDRATRNWVPCHKQVPSGDAHSFVDVTHFAERDSVGPNLIFVLHH